MLGDGSGEEKEEENGSFTLLGVFVACNTCPSEFELIQLKFFCFGKKVISHTQDVIFQIPMVRMWKMVLGTSRQNWKTMQRLTNPG